MITRDNLAHFLLALGYKENKGVYSYEFKPFHCSIKVDFNKEQILYPEEMGLIVNERQTCNFLDHENFVVLECVHRLLRKGYHPVHIEIEKLWRPYFSRS